MATKLQVKCINKSDRTNKHERILAIGGNVGGQQWKHTESSAIQWIKSGVYSYYVISEKGGEVDVIVARSRDGHEYLKTTADGEQPDNLISLPECS
jgi:Protein of unknown function (DUF3892)